MAAKNKHTTASKVASVVSIPGYEIKDLLGRGGMAMVYLAVQESIGREVALKVLSPDHTDETFSERFLREARIASQLSHPNIITIFDAGIHNDVHYMSMEYIQGQSFNEARDALSRKQKVLIIKQIAQALDFASKKGFVHRDIKPENILLHQDGRAILTDFGIAKACDVSKGLTETGKILGTPYFMSPEQTKGLQIDHRTDIYSLGVVLFQALAGYVPYDGPSLVSICIKHLSEPIPQLPKNVAIFQPIINTCMSKNPAHRYQHASELYDALNAISDSQLQQIEVQSTAFIQQGKNHHARTMVESDKIPPVQKKQPPEKQSPTPLIKASENSVRPVAKDKTSHNYIKTDRSTFITDSDDYKNLHRRKRNILVLLVILAVALGYYQRNELYKFWQQKGIALAKQYLPLQYLPAEINKYLETNDKPKAASTIPVIKVKSKSPAEKQKEQAAKLLASIDKIPSNARPLALLYQKTLQANPDDEKTLADISALQQWFFRRIETLTANKHFISAEKTLLTISSLYPELQQSDKLIQLKGRLALDQKNEPYLQQSRVYFAVNALNKPEGANALEQLKIVLTNDPDNQEALDGIEKIVRYFKNKTTTEMNNNKYYQALDSVNAGLQAKYNDPELLELQNRIKNIIHNKNDVEKLLQQARELDDNGHSTSPEGKNAYSIYKQILSRSANNIAAKKGLKKIHNKILKQASVAISQNHFQDATKSLKTGLHLFPNSSELKVLKQKLQAQMDAVLPIIPKIKIDNAPFNRISRTNLKKIKIGQLLYVGFEYNNFTQQTTRLTINVYNGDKQKLILQKPITIDGRTGVHFFTLQLPKTGITNGNYSIEILFANSRLIKANLFGMH